MRVIGGTLRRRKLMAPSEGSIIRPTADRVRQACFDFLTHASCLRRDLLKQAVVLDAFAGTGAWGIEALSRGAHRAIFFDTSSEALSLVQSNVKACGMGLQACIEWVDATDPPLAHSAVDIVFVDPPYGKGLIEKALHALYQKGWFEERTCVVAEHAYQEHVTWPDFFETMMTRHHGRSCLTLGKVKDR